MNTTKILAILIVVIVAALAAGAAQAGCTPCPNSCTAMVDSPRQGVHTAGDETAQGVLWPPNHKFRTVTVSAENGSGDPCNVTITDVRQDEAVDESGSGNTTPDAANCTNAGNESSVDLRGERSGGGTGRYYHILFTMNDPDCPVMPKMGAVLVLVPHDQGVTTTSLDEGPTYESCATTPCSCTP